MVDQQILDNVNGNRRAMCNSARRSLEQHPAEAGNPVYTNQLKWCTPVTMEQYQEQERGRGAAHAACVAHYSGMSLVDAERVCGGMITR